MAIPTALSTGLGASESRLIEVRDYLHTRLRAELQDLKPVAVEPRLKEPVSVYQKLQTGRYADPLDLPDMVGIKVVLLRRSHIQLAIDVLKKTSLRIEGDNLGTPVDPTSLSYFQPHLIVRLPEDYCERHPDLDAVRAEVQITTALQHALDQITHDFDYKGRSFAWKNFRVVSQLRGALQLVDNMLDDIEASASLERFPPISPESHRSGQEALDWLLEHFSDERLPPDLRRTATTLAGLLDAAGVTCVQLTSMSASHEDLINAVSLDPLDALVGVLLRELGAAFLQGYPNRICISDELRSMCPEAHQVHASKVVALSLDLG